MSTCCSLFVDPCIPVFCSASTQIVKGGLLGDLSFVHQTLDNHDAINGYVTMSVARNVPDAAAGGYDQHGRQVQQGQVGGELMHFDQAAENLQGTLTCIASLASKELGIPPEAMSLINPPLEEGACLTSSQVMGSTPFTLLRTPSPLFVPLSCSFSLRCTIPQVGMMAWAVRRLPRMAIVERGRAIAYEAQMPNLDTAADNQFEDNYELYGGLPPEVEDLQK